MQKKICYLNICGHRFGHLPLFRKYIYTWQVVVCFDDISKQMKLLVQYFDIIETPKHFILKQKNVVTMKSNVALCVFWFKFSVYILLFTKAEKLILVEILSPNAALLYQNQLKFSLLHFTIKSAILIFKCWLTRLGKDFL